MYRACIFCSAPLGSNEAIEHFPVGRSLAFDGEKGRLWAVCGRCARWNLAPIHERWEAIEDAERLFHDTRLRVQSENVGLARLRDGTRLIRVGKALPGELAVWRYGGMMWRRRTAAMVGTGIGVGVPVALVGSIIGGFTAGAVAFGALSALIIWEPGGSLPHPASLLPDGGVVDVADLREARFAFTFAGEVSMELPVAVRDSLDAAGGTVWRRERLLLSARDACTVLRRGMVHLNAARGARDRVQTAVNLLTASRSAERFLLRAAADRAPLVDPALAPWARDARMLAVEMAVHEELERDAMRGELAALEEAWRQAEEVAAIADRLPDVDPEAPRLPPEG